MTGEGQTSNRHGLFLLAALSGACGIAYEIIYIRLIANHFGSDFTITATVLSAVFFGMSLGAWHSARLVRHLGRIEIALGLYAFVLATIFSAFGYDVVSFGGTSPAVTLAKLGVLLVLPAFLIGTCVPLFTAYADASVAAAHSRFPLIYTLYNLGAFASGLLIEFVLFRHLGLTITTYAIGVINLVVGGCLMFGRYAPEATKQNPPPQLQRTVGSALFAAAVASGIFQLHALKLSYAVFGPHQENFAIVLVSALLGLFIGAAWSRSKNTSFRGVMILCAALIAVFLLGTTPLVYLWSWIQTLALPAVAQRVVKIVLLGGYALPVFIAFGMTVPLAARVHAEQGRQLYGRLLAVASAGNGVGALLMLTVLFAWLPLPVLGAAIAVLVIVAASMLGPGIWSSAKGPFAGAAISLLLAAAIVTWPSSELALGYRAIANFDELLARKDRITDVVEYKQLDQSAQLVKFDDNQLSLILNGYQSLDFGPGSFTPLREAMVGTASALYSRNVDKALVLGLGSGVTASATAEVYTEVTAIEINPTLVKMLPHFADINDAAHKKPNLDIRIEDGVMTLIKAGTKFDVIVNTVTSPHYYASSKLYTADFFALIRNRLSAGGIYSGWFDLTIGLEGIDYMLNTLERSFAECRYIFLSIGYFNAACGAEPLERHSKAKLEERYDSAFLKKVLADTKFELSFSDLLAALEIRFGPDVHQRSSARIGTLDRPLVEFVIAQSSDHDHLIQKLFGILGRNVSAFKKAPGSIVSFEERCGAFENMLGVAAPGCPGDPNLNTAKRN